MNPRLKTLPATLALLSAVIWSGCSSTPTKVDSGKIHGRTFAFVDNGARTAPEYADTRPEVHEAIQGAITRDLKSKGLTRVATRGDVTVAYLLIIGNNGVTTSLNQYFGYGDEAAGLVEKVHVAEGVKGKNPNYFEAGTLVIDLIDTRTYKLLQRRTVQREILRNLTPEQRGARVQDAVSEALRDITIVAD